MTMMRMTSAVLLLLSASTTSAFAPAINKPSFATRLYESGDVATEFDLKAYIASKLGRVEEALKESVVSLEPQTEKICESMLYSLMAGGKRIRPVLCLAACEVRRETRMPIVPLSMFFL